MRSTVHGRRAIRLRGNALIETVFALSVLLSVAMGTVEFGQFLYIKHAFNSAARDGARAAIVSGGTQAKVVTAITNALAQANVTYNSSWVTITDTTTSATVTDVSTVPTGDTIKVSVSVNYDLIPNVVRPLYTMTANKFGIKNGKPMTGVCSMMKE
jgi:Flp pilus assembly protein TadG